MLKDTKIWLHSLSVASFGFIVLYILGKWLQKEDIAESAGPHFFFKWGFEVTPVSNNSRMLEAEDLGHIVSPYMPLEQGL